MLNDTGVPYFLASFPSVFHFSLYSFFFMSLLTHSSMSFSSLSFSLSQWMDSGLSGVSGQSVMLNAVVA